MINQEDYEVLKELDDKWKWIARDGFKGELNVYNVRPTRSYFKNWWLTNKWFGRSKTISPYFFPFIQWSDSEPYFIPELIEEYEGKGDVGYSLKKFAESLSEFNEKSLTKMEEEMKKDKDWLSEQVGDLNSTDAVFNESGVSYIDTAVSIERVYDLIYQLDEPEVPVVPEDVYEHIKMKKDGGVPLDIALDGAIGNLESLGRDGIQFHEFRNNQDNYAKAWLAYPDIEVEKQLYYVRILEEDEDSYIVKDLNTGKFEMGSKDIHPNVVAEYQTAFTKDEIELMDNGQVLFHTYAEEVSE